MGGITNDKTKPCLTLVCFLNRVFYLYPGAIISLSSSHTSHPNYILPSQAFGQVEMRISKLTFTIAAVFASVASCQMVVPALLDEEEAGERGPGATTQQMEALAKLAKLRELAEMQEASGDGNKYHILPLKSSSDEAAVTGERLICDVLPTERSISIFFDLIMSDYDLVGV